MKFKNTIRLALAFLGVWVVAAPTMSAAADAPASPPAASKVVVPTAADLQVAIGRAKDFLLNCQNSNGWWSTSEQPAVTALVLTALNFDASEDFRNNRSSELNRAYDFILNSVKPDGSIQRTGLANYNTALCLTALVSANDANFTPVILNARRYLANSQMSAGDGTNATPFDGGIGYGSKYQHSDMNNTLMAIEAMRLSESAVLKPATGFKDKPVLSKTDPDIDWAAVTHFLQNCQNLASVNPADWVSSDPKERGGFVYYPGKSNAGSVTNAKTGHVALRSYGSMSYGGLLSYIYARLGKNDPRVLAVLDWLKVNYTIEENPGMDQQGYYYYLHLMTKALSAAGVNNLKLADDREVDWRAEVAGRLLKLQTPDGSWVNAEKRFWETDAILVTTYAMMTLEIIQAHLNRR